MKGKSKGKWQKAKVFRFAKRARFFATRRHRRIFAFCHLPFDLLFDCYSMTSNCIPEALFPDR
jgi:hypothetical protein